MAQQFAQPYVTLNNNLAMPLLGLGVYNMQGKETEQTVLDALDIGYRLIDTASMYHNEKEVGNAIRQSGIKRNELFVTTKVNNADQGYDATLHAFDDAMQKLNIEYIDLYLVHWPVKGKRKYTWLALEKLYKEGRVKAIGVANYTLPFLHELKDYATIVPALNQVEFSPFLYLKELLDYCNENHIQLQAYSPVARGRKFDDPRLVELATRYDKTPAQMMLRWDLEHGVSAIPKSSNKARLQENFDTLTFKLSAEDVAFMDSFHENFRVVNDPVHML